MNKTFRILFLCGILLLSSNSFAQNNAGVQGRNVNREKWLAEMREYKHDFLTRDLDLSKEQQREFFPLYDNMEDEIERINAETREIENRLADTPDASNLELENGARTIFEQKRAEGQIEMNYFDKFKEILSPRQLLKLKNSERKWQQQLINHHRRHRSDKK